MTPRAISPRFGTARIPAGRFVLRPWERNEVGWIFDTCQDQEIQRWTTVPSPYAAADAVAFVERSEVNLVSGQAAQLAIADVDTGWLHGAIGLWDVGGGEAEIGYWVAPESRGRGVAGAAVQAMVQWAFSTLGFERMRAKVLVGNDVSAAVLRACGFQQIEEPVTCGQRGDDLPAWQFVVPRSGGG